MATKRKVVHSEGRKIIASVYRYLKEEYEFTIVNREPNCDLSHLRNISQRTADATCVSLRTVERVLKEERHLVRSTYSNFSFQMKKKIKRDKKMARVGVLRPLESSEFIAKNAKHVKIHNEGLEKVADEILSSMKEGKLEMPETNGDSIHPSKDYARAADWVFVADALNFCFWSYTGAEKWTVDGHSGYYALEAALRRAINEGIDITNPKYYSKISEKDLRSIMRGDNSAEVPLFEKRISVLHEVGAILLEKYDGTFENCIKLADKSAIKLLQIIIDDFPCFRDETIYAGKKVSLYKRAQILVSDLYYFFGSEGWGDLKDLDKLTIFADYRVPQVLLYFGAVTYTNELMEKLKNDTLLPNGSEEEVEIRGCSVHAVELLKEILVKKVKVGQLNIEVPNSTQIDYYLWCYRRKYADKMESVPFHKTFGIFY